MLRPKPTTRFVIEPSLSCQIRCRMCYHLHRYNSWKETTKPLFQIQREIDAGIARGNDFVDITGGEPTIYKDIIQVIEYAHSRRIKVCIITNGLCSESKTKELLDTKIDDFLVSRHGLEKTHDFVVNCNGAYRKQVEFLDRISPYMKFRFNCVITRWNQEEILAISKEMLKYKPTIVNFISFNPHREWESHQDTENIIADLRIVQPQLDEAIQLLEAKGVWVNIRYFPMCRITEGYRRCVCNDNHVCLEGNTKIRLLDGTSPTIKELATKYKEGEKFWVYALNEKNQLVPGKAHSPRITKTNAPCIKLILDNGEEIVCTPEHLLRKRAGGYIEAKNSLGISLAPLYTKMDEKGYETYYDINTQKYVPTHRRIADITYPSVSFSGMVRHHRNFNRKDNRPENLQLLKWGCHRKYHRKLNHLLHHSTNEIWVEIRQRKNQKMKDLANNPIRKRLSSNRMKTWWANKSKEERVMILERSLNNPSSLQKRRENPPSKGVKHSLETRQKMSNAKKGRVPWNKGIPRTSEEKTKIGTKVTAWYKSGGVSFLKTRWETCRNEMLVMALAASPFKNSTHKQQTGRRMKEWQSVYMNTKRCIRIFEEIQSRELPVTKDTWLSVRKEVDFNAPTFETACKYLGIIPALNHTVVKIENFGVVAEVYDLTVEEYHNFAIDAGIFVHNCFDPKEWDYEIYPKTYEKFREWGINTSNAIEEKGEPCCRCDIHQICGGANKHFHRAALKTFGEILIPQTVKDIDKTDFYWYRRHNSTVKNWMEEV